MGLVVIAMAALWVGAMYLPPSIWLRAVGVSILFALCWHARRSLND